MVMVHCHLASNKLIGMQLTSSGKFELSSWTGFFQTILWFTRENDVNFCTLLIKASIFLFLTVITVVIHQDDFL